MSGSRRTDSEDERSGQAAGTVLLQQEEKGYFSGTVPKVVDGDRYFYQPDDGPPRPDPVSRFQPDGVHEASQVVDPTRFSWTDAGWRGLRLEQQATQIAGNSGDVVGIIGPNAYLYQPAHRGACQP